MKKVVLRIVAISAIVTLAVYLADYAVLRYRMSRGFNPYGSVTVRFYYEVQEKNQRTEYAFDSVQQQTCVNALFPHFGFASCWYARRHTERATKI